MAFGHGKNGCFKLADSGGTLRDISPGLDSVDPSWDVDIPNTPVFGDTGIGRDVVGLKDASINIGGKFDPLATTGTWTVLSGIYGHANTQAFQYGPMGSTTGLPRVTGTCRLSHLGTPAEVEGVLTIEATLLVDGSPTFDTWP